MTEDELMKLSETEAIKFIAEAAELMLKARFGDKSGYVFVAHLEKTNNTHSYSNLPTEQVIRFFKSFINKEYETVQ